MVIQLKKGRDGPSTLTCVRADGTRTWNKLHPFFPVHDLTHCAVESVFGFDQAFFGLVAAGRGIDDFAEPGAATRLPTEALWAENMVGLFDLERANGEPFKAAEFNEALTLSMRQQGTEPFRPVGDDELVRVRELSDTLVGRWHALPAGDTLAVPFPAAAVHA